MGKKKRSKTPKVRGESKMKQSEQSESVSVVVEATSSNKIVICKRSGCFDMSTTIHGFCRLHYISGWKKLKSQEAKGQGKGLDEYMQELVGRFPEEFFERLRSEMDETSQSASEGDSGEEASSDRSSIFDPDDGDEDMDTIIKGIRVEDY